MENLFLKILNMSLTGALVILVVLLARLLLRKAPKVFSYALWAVVLFRLLCPVRIYNSGWSWIPAVQTAPASNGQTAVVVYTQHPVLSAPAGAVNDYFMEHPIPVQYTSPEGVYVPELGAFPWNDTVPNWALIAGVVWLTGAVLLLGYGAVSLLLLRRKLVGSVPLEGEKSVRLADHIPSPFVLGLFRPKIYLPSDLPEGERDYILLHERTHIRRFDHIFRALAWLALAIHWFNPLVWLAFHLAGKDMEMSCDEAVLRKMGRDVRADYSASLLRLSAGKRLPAGPLAFGDGDPKSRIKNVLSYKKPALWVIAAALIAVVCAGAALATDPGSFLGPGKPDDGLSYAFNDDRTAVLITGHKEERAEWFFSDKYHSALCVTGVAFSSGWEDVTCYAFWSSEDRIAVKMELIAPVVLDYTVVVEGPAYPEQAIIERKVSGGEGMDPILSDSEAVELAAHFAYYLRAAENWYLQQTAPLTFALDESGGLTIVRINGSVGGEALTQEALWCPENVWNVWSEDLLGELSMAYPAFAEGVDGHIMAWWTDESRTSVTVTTATIAINSGYAPIGWWTFTVDVDSGTVIEMAPSKWADDARVPAKEVRYYPTSISDEEAVKAARVAAKLLTAAEDWYSRQQAPSADLAADLTFSLDTTGEEHSVRMEGSVGDVTLPRGAFWSPPHLFPEHPYGWLSMVYPAFIDGGGTHITAGWTDEGRTSVLLSTRMTAMLSSQFNAGWWEFTVDLGSGAVTEMTAQANPAGKVYLYPESISDEEAVKAARVAAKLLTAAEDYYNNGAPAQADPPNFPVLPEGDVWMEVVPGTVTPTGLTYQIHNETGRQLMYGEPFGLRVEKNGEWCALETKNLMAFPSIGYILKGNASASKTIGWSHGYGELPPGHYRVTTEVNLEPEREAIRLSAEFEIEG